MYSLWSPSWEICTGVFSICDAVRIANVTKLWMVRDPVRSYEICGGQVFFEHFYFPAKHSIECSTVIIRVWYNRPIVASVIVDSIPLHPKRKKGP
jgi:hypothetical protein